MSRNGTGDRVFGNRIGCAWLPRGDASNAVAGVLRGEPLPPKLRSTLLDRFLMATVVPRVMVSIGTGNKTVVRARRES